ncbi:RdgB/HAM1 family non-canonical purine NTP pyrophosphatase [uncultured Thiothrix sp.]|uniref:RdgB/HAM1 family non-canonical purine NTP pyrophosphatase n=1 Tax=uncultured Thiothrix sp. TaxID=223185 RepID=UPI002603D66E|nr:RdgB/HAM1 family non-canonical purine NTP pyrophosphatase [uncultured Thiothrix sp.]HMT93492.1 RdgB/HAM1 family non-canonical purine NTP pyrophosphatase [Thiolinea sp.]
MTQRLVLASSNAGKLREFNSLLADFGFEVVRQADLGVSDAEETGLSFVENALLKARHASQVTGLAALADDSGLVVDVLDGQPGIYSARFAGQPTNDAANNAKLLEALKDVPAEQRAARFRCCIVLVRYPTDPVPLIAEASWEGCILTELQGQQGFGYDPLFYLPLQACTAAELEASEKNRISHRGQALQRLRTLLAA